MKATTQWLLSIDFSRFWYHGWLQQCCCFATVWYEPINMPPFSFTTTVVSKSHVTNSDSGPWHVWQSIGSTYHWWQHLRYTSAFSDGFVLHVFPTVWRAAWQRCRFAPTGEIQVIVSSEQFECGEFFDVARAITTTSDTWRRWLFSIFAGDGQFF